MFITHLSEPSLDNWTKTIIASPPNAWRLVAGYPSYSPLVCFGRLVENFQGPGYPLLAVSLASVAGRQRALYESHGGVSLLILNGCQGFLGDKTLSLECICRHKTIDRVTNDTAHFGPTGEATHFSWPKLQPGVAPSQHHLSRRADDRAPIEHGAIAIDPKGGKEDKDNDIWT